MEQVNIEKINYILSLMNDDYWHDLTQNCTFLLEEARLTIDEFKENCISLTIIQMDLLGAKHTGYKLLAENKKKSAAPKIISENKAQIDQLLAKKQPIVIELSCLLTRLNAIFEQLQTMGEVTRKGSESN